MYGVGRIWAGKKGGRGAGGRAADARDPPPPLDETMTPQWGVVRLVN